MALKLEFVDASDGTKYKATIQMTGRLSFNSEAAKFMKLARMPHFKVAFERDNFNFKIYLVESEETDTTAKIHRAGNYYYLRLEKALRKYSVDFQSISYTFTIEKLDEQIDGADVFELTKYKQVYRGDVDDIDEDDDE